QDMHGSAETRSQRRDRWGLFSKFTGERFSISGCSNRRVASSNTVCGAKRTTKNPLLPLVNCPPVKKLGNGRKHGPLWLLQRQPFLAECGYCRPFRSNFSGSQARAALLVNALRTGCSNGA